jgi:hypothetical protein
MFQIQFCLWDVYMMEEKFQKQAKTYLVSRPLQASNTHTLGKVIFFGLQVVSISDYKALTGWSGK